MRVGIFGGSFNPIHLGHLRAADEVREAMNLDLVYFVPAAAPPHKPEAGLAAAEHRMHMVRIATKGNRYFMTSDVEVKRQGPSYTIDTVRHFLANLRGTANLFLLMGGDQFGEFATWKDCEDLTQLCSIVVHTRLGEGESGPQRVSLAAVDRFGYSNADDHYVNRVGQTLTFVPTTFFPISASLIRRKIKARQSVRYLLPADVIDYIERMRIY